MAVWKDGLQSGNTSKPSPGASTGVAIYPSFINQGSIDYRLRRLEVGSQRLRAGQVQETTGQYNRIPANTLDTTNQKIDLSLSTIRKVGSVPPTANVSGFAYTSTVNSITWYWDGSNSSTVIVLHRSDGTTQVIPINGSGLTISGLANATTYYFLPYWTPNQGCNVSWVQGTVGAPLIAFVLADTTGTSASFYAMQQALQQNEPLTGGFMSATTGSSGGGGGGGNFCVMSGTVIEPVGDIEYSVGIHKETEWIRLVTEDEKVLFCTRNHPLYHDGKGRMEAQKLLVGDPLITDTGVRYLKDVDWTRRVCSKYSVHMPHGHLYYANGYLSHNQKLKP